MAVLVELSVTSGTREQHDAIDLKVTQAMERNGGPPAGLMFHLVCPDGDGFVLMDVWRDEIAARRFFDTAVYPAMSDIGLEPAELSVRPVWGMASL